MFLDAHFSAQPRLQDTLPATAFCNSGPAKEVLAKDRAGPSRDSDEGLRFFRGAMCGIAISVLFYTIVIVGFIALADTVASSAPSVSGSAQSRNGGTTTELGSSSIRV